MNRYTVSAILFVVFLLLSFQGFDITDEGFHFTNQFQLLENPLSSILYNPMFILSDAVGGMWLHLIDTPNVLWGRLGGALLFSLCTFMVASILEGFFPKKDVFITLLISSIFLTSIIAQYIHYFTFPAFLTLIFLWIFQRILSVSHFNSEYAFYAFILGFLFVFIVLSRFTLILFAIAIPIMVLYLIRVGRPFDGLKRGMAYGIMGGLIATGIVMYAFLNLEMLTVYFDIIKNQLVHSATGGESVPTSHSMTALLVSYLCEYFHAMLGLLFFIGGLFFIVYMRKKISQKCISIILCLIVVFLILLTQLFPQIPLISFLLSYGIPRLFIGLVLLFSFLFLYYHKKEDYKLALLLIMACTLMIINPIGSGTGIIKSIHAFWLILPLSLLCINRLGLGSDDQFVKTISSLVPTILMVMLIFAVFFHATHVYRDDPNRLNLTTPFESPQLKWTYSTPERVQVTDELIAVMERETDPGDYVLMVNGMPMFYYLTETRPALGQPWLFLYSNEKIMALEEERLREGEIEPRLFIYSKVNPRDRYWPNSTVPINDSDEEKLNSLKIQYINNNHYTFLWENDAFVVYLSPQ